MAQVVLVLAYAAVCLVIRVRRQQARQPRRPRPGTVAGWLRTLGLGSWLLPVAMLVLLLGGPNRVTVSILLLAGVTVMFAPRLSAWLVPFSLLLLALYVVLLVTRSWYGWGGLPLPLGLPLAGTGAWRKSVALWQGLALAGAGGWLLYGAVRRSPRLAWALLGTPRHPVAAPSRPAQPPWHLLLFVVAVLYLELAAPHILYGAGAGLALVLITGLIVLALVRLLPAVAADLSVAGLLGYGLFGVLMALGLWPLSFGPYSQTLYGGLDVANQPLAVLAGLQGVACIGCAVWLFPRAVDRRTRALLWPSAVASEAEAELAGRVEQLTQTRADAVDNAAAELRRVERDLHDGAQARLVAVGMNLRAAQKIITTSPEAASQLLAEAIETSSRALTELRNLVRGIHPPVLADRGLPDAIRALALDTPLHTVTDIELAGRPEPPVESACYFAVAEALANAVKHAGARHVQIHARHDGELLRIEVTDDGAGGADPARGSGLRGLERRLATFDGILAVSSPPGGPTLIVIEVPCALSSPKTSSC
jgi:signal transduction histidine kinase